MADNKAKDNPKTWNFGDIVTTFVPLIGIFTAFCYLLGRSFIDSYYAALGIKSGVLSFAPNDYMFSSFMMVIFCLFITGLFFMYWELSKRGKSILLDEGMGKNYRMYVAIPLIVIMVLSIAYLVTSLFMTELKIPILMLVASVLILGIGLVLYTDIIHGKSRFTGGKSLGDSYAVKVISAIFIGIVISLLTITPIDTLAQTQAKNDREYLFPSVDVICKKELPEPLRNSLSNTCVLRGRLVLTNNGMTYILSEQDLENWVIYAIPVENIDSIMYMPHREYEKDVTAK